MRLIDDDEAVSWFQSFTGHPDEFDCDAGNLAKLEKHGVAAADVESVFRALIVFAGRIVEPVHDEPRWLALGQSETGQRLALIMTRRGARLRPISCRLMRRNERKLHEEAIAREKEGR